MKIVASLTDPLLAAAAEEQGAQVLELRFDLMDGDPGDLVKQCEAISSLPIIATFRSAEEGGRYFGSADEWCEKICSIITLVEYVDIEQKFSREAGIVKDAGKTIIASHHSSGMMTLQDLFLLDRDLRTYGDIPKIIVTPRDEDDLIDLISFTRAVKKPVCTGVMGASFRYARAILPLFGSELVYCHTGDPTAAGQYSVEEFVSLAKLLTT